MPAVIALRPEDDRGREILDKLEKQTEVQPEQVIDDGTRRYHLHGKGVYVSALDPMLDKIDPDWRDHVESRRDKWPWVGHRRSHTRYGLQNEGGPTVLPIAAYRINTKGETHVLVPPPTRSRSGCRSRISTCSADHQPRFRR